MTLPTTRIAAALALACGATASAAPSPCPADFNRDGRLNIQDFMGFHDAYRRADLRADFDGNGQVDIRDAVNFRAELAHGC